MRSKSVAWLIVSVSLGLAGCESRGVSAGAHEVRDSAGVEIVSNFVSSGWSAEDAPRLVEELRIGAVEGDPRYMFAQLMGIDVDEAGRIYTVDMQAKQVSVFDPDGSFVHSFGRAGSGPGEFRTPLMVTVLKHEIRVLDVGSIVRFDRNGTELDREGTGGATVFVHRLPNDSELLEWRKETLRMSSPTELEQPDDLLVRRQVAGDHQDTVLAIPAAQTMMLDGGTLRMQANAPTPVWALAGDRILLAKSNEFRIEELSLEGELRRVFSLDVEPTSLSDARRGEIERQTSGVRGVLERAMGVKVVDEAYPFNVVVGGLLMGPVNTRWVNGLDVRAPPGEEVEYVWYIFDEDGLYRGPIDLPARFTPFVTRHERLYGVQRDELGVQYVVRLRMEGI